MLYVSSLKETFKIKRKVVIKTNIISIQLQTQTIEVLDIVVSQTQMTYKKKVTEEGKNV